MKQDVMLDRLSEIARASSPPSLTPAAEDALIRRAVERAGRAPAERDEPRTHRAARAAIAAAALALLAAGATAAFVHSGASEARRTTHAAAPDGEPLSVELPTGDRLIATPGASFRLTSSTQRERGVAMDAGTMVFDVARLGDGQAFEVETPHLAVRVLGTVFSVTASDDGTIVRVFEGAVAVRDGGDRRIVRASQRYSSSDGAVAALETESPLDSFAWRATVARAVSATERVEDGQDSPEASADHPGGVRAEGAGGPRITTDEEPSLPDETRPTDGPDDEAADSAERSSDVVAPARRAAPVDPAATRALIAQGLATRALWQARQHEGGEWRHVEADALRALRRFEEAAAAYDRAARELDGTRAHQAGYLAASVRLLELADPSGALDSLDRARADAPGSPFEERAIALRVRSLRHLDRHDDARSAAQHYLDRYPEGGMAEQMRALLEPPRSAEAVDELD